MFDTIVALLAWTVVNSGYEQPKEMPSIEIRPHAHFVEAVCGAEIDCKARGYYRDGSNLIVLHETYERLDSIEKKALVVHEITHFLQDRSGRWPAEKTCKSWLQREREAFQIQLGYIAQKTQSLEIFRFMPKFDTSTCAHQ